MNAVSTAPAGSSSRVVSSAPAIGSASNSYVLVTPVRDEEATIGITIESVIRQTIQPKEWVIVSDQSKDRTDEIVKEYSTKHKFIRLLRLERRPGRNFGSVVFATEAGIAALTTKSYEFIGLLDADIRFAADYYEKITGRFSANPKLGMAGGVVIDCYGGIRRRYGQSLRDIAGAVQFFRRECFDAMGGLVALPEGGWDTITCVQARMNGFKTETFEDIEVDHLKPRNIGEGKLVQRTWQLGVREYAVGNHPLFEIVKCGYRCAKPPFIIGGLLRLAAYTTCCVSGRKRALSPEIIKYTRQEQLRRLLPFNR